MNLTDQEIFRLVRRRQGYNQTQFAELLGVFQFNVSEWEMGFEEIPTAYLKNAKKLYQKMDLMDHEKVHILRRRLGLTIRQAAGIMGISNWTLVKKERGESPCDKYLEIMTKEYSKQKET